MKPTDLKSPFSWDDRRVHIDNRIWFVPTYYDKYEKFNFPGWESPLLFGNNNPVHIEYCSGNGLWIASRAQQFPEINWVAVELKFERARKIWAKIQNLKLDNLVVVCGEGHQLTQLYIPDDSISQVYINFPDPWPKNKHAKHRIIKPTFLTTLHQKIRLSGGITFVTDDEAYSNETIEIFTQQPGFASSYPAKGYVNDYPGYGDSYFESLWRSKGKEIRYHHYEKR